MAYEFQRLDAVTEVTEVSDDATVLIEEDGAIKRAPKSAVGGGGGIPTVAMPMEQVISFSPPTVQLTDEQVALLNSGNANVVVADGTELIGCKLIALRLENEDGSIFYNMLDISENGTQTFTFKYDASAKTFTLMDEGFGTDLVTESTLDSRIPEAYSSDEGKILKVVNGVPTWVTA